MKNKFLKVFENVNLPTIFIENYKNVDVSEISINKSTCAMSISFVSHNIIRENFGLFEKFIIDTFPYIKNITINISYNLQNKDYKSILKDYWINICDYYMINRPIISQALKDCKWDIKNDVLTIFVLDATLFDGSQLSCLINERFGINITVVVTDDKDQKEKNDKYFEYMLKKEAKIVSEIKKQQQVLPQQVKKTVAINNTYNRRNGKRRSEPLKIVNEILLNPTSILDILQEKEFVIKGEVFFVDIRERGELNITVFSIFDGNSSIDCKFFCSRNEVNNYKGIIYERNYVIVKGQAQYDTFSKEIVLMAKEICQGENEERNDNSSEKRVELHLHTNMSQMDAVTSITDYIKQAKKWGHKAIAVTDHGVVQAYPEASYASDIKIIYGMEAYVVDDQKAIVYASKNQNLSDDYVVFDIETTGLSKETNKIIEIGAIKIKNGEIIGEFSTLIDPKMPLTPKIIELTNITDDMLIGKPTEEEAIPKFLEFCEDFVLVAHNVSFDVGFIRTSADRILDKKINNTTLDTVELGRLLLPNLKNHKLNTIAAHFEIDLQNHHRAVDDATATAHIFLKFIEMLREISITTVNGINEYASQFIDTTKIKNHNHTTILALNNEGLKNLYKLVSDSHTKYFYRNNRRPKRSRPRIPRSELIRMKNGLLIGTACIKGELYEGLLENKPEDEIQKIVEFYDFLEVQPDLNYEHLVKEQKITADLKKINSKIVELGKKFNKTVVATGDVHFLKPGQEIHRNIILFGEGNNDFSPPFYLRTTEEMLSQFSYLGEDVAYEIVVTNTNKIADMVDDIVPIPKGTFAPSIQGSDEDLRDIATKTSKEIYGYPLPNLVEERLSKELNSIIKNGFAVMYMAAHKLIERSLNNRYTVGSRGSVGSSFVATMSQVTEVNPLPAHYLCKTCKYSEFDTEEVLDFSKKNPGGSGCDLPDKPCIHCGNLMDKEGHDIPFETFLGFEGDKEPDIDLNFSGEYQQQAHDHATEIFGSEKVFKAGTISTLADKTAYGYTMKYLEEKKLKLSKAEINRIKLGATGVKRTTGQHPGGLMVVPNTHSIYDFTPIQRPANDIKTTVTTTHFDYRSISGRLLKLDLLGHDVPTIIRMLWDITKIDPTTVPLSDKRVLSIFSEPTELGISKNIVETGSLGIPEFGTSFVRGMLLDTKPESFGELVRISGLSHGTDVWLNNAQELIRNKTCTLKDVIATRDDIMVYLISKGMDKRLSFFITENVRKGKGITYEWEAEMLKAGVPRWYIESCKKIKYMFPKGHAVAYVMMAVRIAYYKVYHPKSFYAAIFSVRTNDFNYELMCIDKNVVKMALGDIKNNVDATASEKSTLATLELVNEMYERGFNFSPIDIYKSHETKFIVTDDGIMPPLASINGLGEAVANNIVEERKLGEFTSLDDFKEKTKANKTTLDLLVSLNILKGLPQGRQLTLF